MSRKGLLILAQDGDSTRILVNRLELTVGVSDLVIEQPVPRHRFAAKRVRRLGIGRVVGQLLFVGLVVPLLGRRDRARVKEIKRVYALDTRAPGRVRIRRVPSVNTTETIDLLRQREPALVVLSGTRIVSPEVLEAAGAPVLNLHAGITPAYRGVHGAYWALATRDPARCGVTLHLVDAGVDTGDIVAQADIMPSHNDSFVTYPLLQLAAGLPLLERTCAGVLAGETVAKRPAQGESACWTHPTLWGYLVARVREGVR